MRVKFSYLSIYIYINIYIVYRYVKRIGVALFEQILSSLARHDVESRFDVNHTFHDDVIV